MDRWRTKKGFTLVELSVVLVVIAIITSMGVAAGIDSLESTRRVATTKKLDVIEAALLAFREKYGRLPCPADAGLPPTNANYGVEAANPGTCTGGTPAATHITADASATPSGAVPVHALGLPNEFMYDGWEWKFHYEVTPAMTAANAFAYSQPYDDCAITVKDHSDADLPKKPVYALVSYGKNGEGAYVKSGLQPSDNRAGTAEQTNIRTVTDTPTIRTKNGVSGAMGSAGYYDDIVRFKSRYQLMDENDRKMPVYRGPELVLSYPVTSGTQMVYGKKKCGQFQFYTGTVPDAVAAVPKFMAFTPDNTNFFVYHTNSCKLYSNINTMLAAVTEPSPVPNCPEAATAGAMAQANGMLALNETANPNITLRIYKMLGTGAAAKYVELKSALVPALTAAPDNISFSQNGEYLAVSKSGSYAKLYVKKDDHYHDLGTLPGDAYTEYSNTISPDGKYYAITEISGSDTLVYIWRNINGTFSQILSGGSPILYTAAIMPAGADLTFSPTSDYLAVTSPSMFYVLHINPQTEAVSESVAANPGPTAGGARSVVAFSRDASFMAISRANTGSNGLLIFRRSGATTFTQDTNSSTFTFGGMPNFVTMSR